MCECVKKNSSNLTHTHDAGMRLLGEKICDLTNVPFTGVYSMMNHTQIHSRTRQMPIFDVIL